MRTSGVRSGGMLMAVAMAWFIALGVAVTPPSAAFEFTVPPMLLPQVDFWVNIFARYGKRQVVIHDTERLDRVYSVVDLSDLDREGLTETQIELAMKAAESDEKDRIRSLLRRLDQVDPASDSLTAEEQRIVGLFADDPSPGRFAAAAADDRLRGQRGLRERFARGLQIAHGYFPYMEQTFVDEGVPPEITRLPMVESCFDVHAYSKVGAAGVWQFMPSTARNYMRVDGVIDERLDPIISTRAAARFMRQNYDKLGTWPLAIKAYNHGPAGIARAVRETGTTDPALIIQNYRGPSYKFASRNFYPEFLAALLVERNYRTYFGDLALDPPLTVDSVLLTQYTPLSAAARCAGTDPWELAALNPSLLPAVHAGRRPIPAGFELRVPHGRREAFRSCAVALPVASSDLAERAPAGGRPFGRTLGRTATESAKRQRHIVHKVEQGQTLGQIASLYGCSVDQIRRGNNLKNSKIHAGQRLRIPVS